MAKCSIHGTELVLREGVSKKTNEPYSFLACPEKNADGSFCKGKPMAMTTADLPNTPATPAPAASPIVARPLDKKERLMARMTAINTATDKWVALRDAGMEDQTPLQIANEHFKWLMEEE